MTNPKSRMRRRTTIAVALLGLAAAPLAASTVAGAATTRQVSVEDTFFSARKLTVSRGDTVRWVWRGTLGHDVYFKNKSVQPRSKPFTDAEFKATVKTVTSFIR